MRTVTEQHVFTKDQLEALAKVSVKMAIVGPIYRGEFGAQVTEWLPDGSLRVATTHTPDN